jgi:hypothetical protein
MDFSKSHRVSDFVLLLLRLRVLAVVSRVFIELQKIFPQEKTAGTSSGF